MKYSTGMKTFIAVAVLWTCLIIATIGCVIYTAAHFILKYW